MEFTDIRVLENPPSVAVLTGPARKLRWSFCFLALLEHSSFSRSQGQIEKNSVRAYVFRFAPESGHRALQSACLEGANKRLVPLPPSCSTDVAYLSSG